MLHYALTLLLLTTSISALTEGNRDKIIYGRQDEDPANKLDKPTSDSYLHREKIYVGLKQLTSPAHNIEVWTNGSIPEFCYSGMKDLTFNGQNLSFTDVEVFSVIYEDCAAPWMFCRHNSAFDTKEVMAEQFGRTPVGLRDYVFATFSVGSDDQAEGRAYYLPTTGGQSLSNNSISDTGAWIHEAAHAIDDFWLGKGDASADYSLSQEWLDAYNQITAVIDPYAQTNQGENFAETLVAAVYDLNFDGGLATLTADNETQQTQIAHVQPQLDLLREKMGTQLRAFTDDGSPAQCNIEFRTGELYKGLVRYTTIDGGNGTEPEPEPPTETPIVNDLPTDVFELMATATPTGTQALRTGAVESSTGAPKPTKSAGAGAVVKAGVLGVVGVAGAVVAFV